MEGERRKRKRKEQEGWEDKGEAFRPHLSF
jgi:hypothetical protein